MGRAEEMVSSRPSGNTGWHDFSFEMSATGMGQPGSLMLSAGWRALAVAVVFHALMAAPFFHFEQIAVLQRGRKFPPAY
jgi:hypothetical protein